MEKISNISTLDDLAKYADYSLIDTLNCDPHANEEGIDHSPRQVFTGHYVTVKPTPIENPEYVAHSKNFFHEMGFADSLAESEDFMRMFSGDLSQYPEPMRKLGWATGNYSFIRELQDVITQPYAEQTKKMEVKYYKLKPSELSEIGGVSHLSCSS